MAAPSFTNRFHLILESITSANHSEQESRILCLQEADNEIIPLLLNNARIQEMYAYSNHTPSTTNFESKRNLVTLGSEPFTSFTLDLVERHKSALIIALFDTNVMVANVHLTSALTDISVTAKHDKRPQ